MLSYEKEAFVCFGGPFANLAAFLCLLPLRGAFPSALANVSLLLAATHLLPIIPLDGGRILFDLFTARLGQCGMRLAIAISFAALCVTLFFFLYFLLYYGVGLTPFFSLLFLFREQQKPL